MMQIKDTYDTNMQTQETHECETIKSMKCQM